MRRISALLLFVGCLANATESEFLSLCKGVGELPLAKQSTVKSLIKVGQGVFSLEPKSCEEVYNNLKKTESLRLHGQTFEYLVTEDLSPITTLEWIQHLDITGQRKTTDLSPLKKLNLKTLRIANTGVGTLSEIAELPSLEVLGVSLHSFTSLRPLQKLTKLRQIEVAARSGNEFRINLSELSLVPSLKAVHVNVSFGMIPTSIVGLEQVQSLEELVVRYTRVDAASLVGLNLKRLHVAHGELENVAAIAALQDLEALTLSFQGLENIDFLRTLTKLKQLDLSHNAIKNANVIQGMQELEELNLGSNQIWFDRPLRDLSKLRQLRLYDNKIGTLVISNMTQLELLNVGSNRLYDLSFQPGTVFPALKTLELGSNSLRSAVIGRFSGSVFPALSRLVLSHNKIADVSALASIGTLERLALDDNKISDVSALSTLHQLKQLSARYNLLRDLTCPVQPQSICDFLYQES